MCILFLYVDPKPQANAYRFVAASNRDEFYRRPAQFVGQEEQVIGGRDLEESRSGGMWLGVSLKQTEQARFRFGALLNITGEKRAESKGRGFIVSDYLHGSARAEDYIGGLLDSPEPYNGFNFVAAEINAAGETVVHHCSNIPSASNVYLQEQFLGFGNTSPTLELKKVGFGLGKFEEVVGKNNSVENKKELVEELLMLLKNENKQLPDEILQTRHPLMEDQHPLFYQHFSSVFVKVLGVNYGTRQLPDEILEKRQPQFFQHLSCVFVKILDVNYGTRTHSIVLVDYDWNVEFHEVTMEEPIDPEHPVWKTNVVRAKL